MNLIKKTALITGACNGIGEATALAFAREGTQLILISNNKNRLEATIKKIALFGVKATSFVVDIADDARLQELLENAYLKHGRIDILVNCAGIFLQKKITDMTVKEWKYLIDVNLTGTFVCCNYIIPKMIEQKEGLIFNFSSIGGKIGLKEKSAYCASKFGVVGLSKALAKELKPFGIKVHIVYPYLVDSEKQINWDSPDCDECGILKVEDVANMIVYMAKLPKRVYVEDVEIKPYLYSK
ncbi:MAG: SDR family oxidoreductase [Candidatus Omnitrophica bacterium]|nr:SDR family oxidoreductase [Candidatus Omnitrophota bacterium]